MSPHQEIMYKGLILAALAVCMVNCGTFYMTTEMSDQCKYTGYKPGGEEPSSEHVKSQAAKIQETALQSIVGKFNDGAGVTAATLGVMNSAGKLLESAPHVAAALGAISVAFGLGVSSPGPQDILDKANEAVAQLASDVNDRLEKMKDYVDYRVIELEQNLMTNKYKTFFYKWIHCAEERLQEDADKCQKDVERSLKSARYEFQILHEKQNVFDPNSDARDLYVWQFLEEYRDQYQSPSHYEVKRLEAGLIPFRNLASLHLMVLQTLAATYKDAQDEYGCGEYKHYLEDMRDRAEEYATYAKWAVEWIYIRNYEENMWNGIPGRTDERAPFFLQKGGYAPTLKCIPVSGSKGEGKITTECTVECHQMNDDNRCTFKDTISTSRSFPATVRVYSSTENVAMAKIYNMWDHRNEICAAYLEPLRKDMNNYWKTEVLESAEKWSGYSESAQQALDGITGC